MPYLSLIAQKPCVYKPMNKRQSQEIQVLVSVCGIVLAVRVGLFLTVVQKTKIAEIHSEFHLPNIHEVLFVSKCAATFSQCTKICSNTHLFLGTRSVMRKRKR